VREGMGAARRKADRTNACIYAKWVDRYKNNAYKIIFNPYNKKKKQKQKN
jgi:hypothetical protein